MVVRILHPKELGPDDIARWRELQAAAPALRNPYFSPEFAMAVGAARASARVALIRDRDGREGVFSAQRPSGLAAMALGAPVSDYQGLIGPIDLAIDGPELCAGHRVGRMSHRHADTKVSQFMEDRAVHDVAAADRMPRLDQQAREWGHPDPTHPDQVKMLGTTIKRHSGDPAGRIRRCA